MCTTEQRVDPRYVIRIPPRILQAITNDGSQLIGERRYAARVIHITTTDAAGGCEMEQKKIDYWNLFYFQDRASNHWPPPGTENAVEPPPGKPWPKNSFLAVLPSGPPPEDAVGIVEIGTNIPLYILQERAMEALRYG